MKIEGNSVTFNIGEVITRSKIISQPDFGSDGLLRFVITPQNDLFPGLELT